MNLAALLLHSANNSPENVALRAREATLAYGELADRSLNLAQRLATAGVSPGDRVALMLPNTVEFVVSYYAALCAGAVVVPINPLLKSREVSHYISDSGARHILAQPAHAREVLSNSSAQPIDLTIIDPTDASTNGQALSAAVECRPDDVAVILYTSGTTGRPKGACLTHSNLIRNIEVTQADLLRLRHDDVVFGGLPLFHSFGQTVTLNTTLAAGARLVLVDRFEPSHAARTLVDEGVTIFAGVPTMYIALLNATDTPRPTSLRASVSGGAALPVEVLHRFEREFGGIVLEGYGLSETSPVASFNPPDGPRRPGSIGRPLSGIEMRIVGPDGELPAGEIGEVAIRGHNIMKGYWGNAEATASAISPDGWFHSGDLGRMDDDGYFYIVDRKKDLIIRGGYNVYPREIEEVLYEHPAVSEAAVVGVPHPELGEEVAAVVVVRPDVEAGIDDLREFVRAQVAPYKYPRIIHVVASLPKGPTGKILKREITVPGSAATLEKEDAARDDH